MKSKVIKPTVKKHVVHIEDVSEPFCGSRRKNLVPLVDGNPRIAGEWCYKKNAGWGPEHFSVSSGVRAWWTCPNCHLDYKAMIATRTYWRNQEHLGCPYCRGLKVCDNNSLAVLHPEIARQWHPTKNGKRKATDYTHFSNKRAWWLCSECHTSWQAEISSRIVNNSFCPFCANQKVSKTNSLKYNYPKIAAEWHPTKNGKVTPADVICGSKNKYWWKCPQAADHIWLSSVGQRALRKQGCPFCAGNRASRGYNLKKLFPAIAKEFHPTKNGELKATSFTPSSGKKVWWKCEMGDDHEWQATIVDRTDSTKCPFCAGSRASKTTSLAARFKNIAKTWHSTKNGDLTPEQFLPYSGKLVWWQCVNGHELEQTIQARVKRKGHCDLCKLY